MPLKRTEVPLAHGPGGRIPDPPPAKGEDHFPDMKLPPAPAAPRGAVGGGRFPPLPGPKVAADWADIGIPGDYHEQTRDLPDWKRLQEGPPRGGGPGGRQPGPPPPKGAD